MQNFSDIAELMRNVPEAKEYFEKLPAYARDQISTRADSVNSFASLQDYAENVLRGDG